MRVDICRHCEYHRVRTDSTLEFCIERYCELPMEMKGHMKLDQSNLNSKKFKLPVLCPFQLEILVESEC